MVLGFTGSLKVYSDSSKHRIRLLYNFKWNHSHYSNKTNIDKSKKYAKRPETETIRTQIKPSKPEREITKITNSQNIKRTYGQLFPKRWPQSNQNRTKNNMNTRKVKHAKGMTSIFSYLSQYQPWIPPNLVCDLHTRTCTWDDFGT